MESDSGDLPEPSAVPKTRIVFTLAPLLAIAAGLPVGLSRAAAQSPVQDPLLSPAPEQITGRDLGGVSLGASVQQTDVVITASRAWAWAEGGAANEIGADGLPISTQRLLLQGDVKVRLGSYEFTAAQAVVWIRSVGNQAPTAAGVDGEIGTRQIAIHFDRVADPGAQAGFAQAGDRLLVTAAANGIVSIKADSMNSGRPESGAGANFVRESEQRLAAHIKAVLTNSREPITPPPAALSPGVISGVIIPGRSRPYEPNSPLLRQKDVQLPETRETTGNANDPLFAKDGIVTFAVGTRATGAVTSPEFGDPAGNTDFIRIVRGETDNTLLLTGGVAVQYTDLRQTRNLLITAERAVVFLDPGPLSDLARFNVEQIRGVYLEGDVVATDGRYTLRGPRVYYDFKENKAVMADAVFSTVDAKTGLPIWVRAKTLRQEAANKVTAEQARLSTSSFFTPTLTIGSSSITVSQVKSTQGNGDIAYVDAKDFTLRFSGVPVFWLPGFEGEIDEIPLEDVRVENSSDSGAALKTTWNLPALLGLKAPEGVNVRALLDYYFDRGPAIGTRAEWKREKYQGSLFGYLVFNDDGRDVLSSGERKEIDEQTRGMILADNRFDLTPNWSLFTEASYISDETFIDGFFRDLGREGREFTNAAYLRYIGENQSFGVLAKGTFNDFVSNQYLLQSQGYSVNKLPEITYARVADDILPGTQPGLLTWTHEYRASRMRFVFDESRANEIGYSTDFRAQSALGINANQTIADRLRAIGYTREDVMRGDTRQELTATLDFYPVKIVPFAVGRFTGYDQKFEDFSLNAGPDVHEDQYRAWYAVGSRFSTTLTRINNETESSLLDLHRIRHIVEPNATVWWAGSTVSRETLPVYDDSVESLNAGAAVRAGVNQVFQTQRGGPGRWRNVDVLKISTDFTFASNDTDNISPIGRFTEYRPEYSFLGNFFTGDVAWQATDAVSFAFNQVYDFDLSQPARTIAGGMIQHNPEFSTYGQVRYINALDVTYVDMGLAYQLTRKYAVAGNLTYDTDRSEVQEVSGSLRRRFPDATLGFKLGFNTITEETNVGLVFEPQIGDTQAKSDRLREIRR
jgi:hypothetical protein